MSDHYRVLNVSRTASVDEIKKAYKKLAVVWHPDKNPDNQIEATEKFRAIAEAYEILSDPEQRQQYDRGEISSTSFENNPRSAPRNSFNHSFSNKRAFDIFNSFFADFDDFHQQAFNGFGIHSTFGGDPFNRNGGAGMGQRAQIPRGFGMQNSLFHDDFFGGDPFAGGMGGGMHQQMHTMMLGGGGAMPGFGGMGVVSSSSSTSFSSSSGMNGAGRSVSTSTSIGQDGRKVTRKEITVIHPGGRRETTVEESVEEPSGGAIRGNNRLSYNGNSANGSSHSRAIDLTASSGDRNTGVSRMSTTNSRTSGAPNYGGMSRR